MGKSIGAAFTVHPVVMKEFKTKGYFSLAIIDFTDLEKKPLKEKTKYHAIAKFPSSSFEATVLVNKNIPSGKVVDVLSQIKAPELKDVKLLKVFDLGDQFKAVTIKTIFEDSSKTLEADGIKNLENLVIKTLDEQGFPLKK